MPTLSRFVAPRVSPRLPVVTAGAILLFSRGGFAQTAAAPPAPFALTPQPAQPAKTRTVSILIIALDDPATVGGAATGTEAGTATLPEAPPLTAAPPMTNVPLTALPPEPMSWHGAPAPWNWSVLAKKAPPKPDPRFLPVPDPPSNVSPDLLFHPGAVSPAPNGNAANNSAPNTIGAPPAPTGFARPVAPAGRGLLAALALRRALAGWGYANVETAAPDSNLIARALGDNRLAPNTLPLLRSALQDLAAAPALGEAQRTAAIGKATQSANDAASALGQATGYRAVVAVYMGALAGGKAPFAVVLSDSARESGEPLVWSESAATEDAARESGATTGAAMLDKSLRQWPLTAPLSPKALADVHLDRARAAGAAGNLRLAQDEVVRVTALDPTRADAYTLLGDLLAPTDLPGAVAAYRKATQINQKDGQSYAKIAVALINSPRPDFPRVLEAGKQAIAGGADTPEVRVAMAQAQFGRADLFRRANRIESAEDAEADAQTHLDRALQLAPNNSDALKLMARALITSGRTLEGVQVLDRVAPLYPKDIDLQYQYANALLSVGNRKEDAFVAFSRVWKARGQAVSGIDDSSAQLLAQGFDEHIFALGKSARQLSDGVAGGSIAREAAFLQLARLKSDMNAAADAIALLRPTASASVARNFAAQLMSQSLENQQTFLDTGQPTYRNRAAELFRQSVAQLNAARLAR